MTSIILLILGIIFIFSGFIRLFFNQAQYNPGNLMPIFSGLLLLAKGMQSRIQKKNPIIKDLTEYKLLASKLYLKGKSDKKVIKVLIGAGLPEEQIHMFFFQGMGEGSISGFRE